MEIAVWNDSQTRKGNVWQNVRKDVFGGIKRKDPICRVDSAPFPSSIALSRIYPLSCGKAQEDGWSSELNLIFSFISTNNNPGSSHNPAGKIQIVTTLFVRADDCIICPKRISIMWLTQYGHPHNFIKSPKQMMNQIFDCVLHHLPFNKASFLSELILMIY